MSRDLVQKEIVLCTLNARYIHTSLSLRYIYANLKELKDRAVIVEFVINDNILEMVERILNFNPKIVAFSVYIWNATEISEIIKIIKEVAPEIIVVLGGAEVSYEPLRVDFECANYIIKGEGEESFYRLCKEIFCNNYPKNREIESKKLNLLEVESPYRYYSDEDIKNRVIYVESSRGCNYLCEFCLSSILRDVRLFDIELFLDEVRELWRRGARSFKFIDRTFNTNIEHAKRVLEFFLDYQEPYFLHFELIPDNFPDDLKSLILKFPKGSLQFEVGIQTLNRDVSKNISRHLNIQKCKESLLFLKDSHIHTHLDLIVGLPGESLDSFRDGFNTLLSLSESEIQIGVLKKLSGVKIDRHNEQYKMKYQSTPPYEILQNSEIDFKKMQELKRFSRFFDIYYNSGNFKLSMKILFESECCFSRFLEFSNYIYKKTLSTYKISLERQVELIYGFLLTKGLDKERLKESILEDILKVDGRKVPKLFREDRVKNKKHKELNSRQKRHST